MTGPKTGKKWTKADDEYLSDFWGRLNIKRMATVLGRTPSAVRTRAYALGLGKYIDGDGMVTFAKLLIALGLGHKNHSHYKEKLIKAGIPIYKKKIYQKTVLKIDLKDFWKWANKHRALINWSKLQENDLGKEPAWVKERRRIDFYNYANYHKEWTLNEDDTLTHYIEKGLLVKDIAVKLGRSEGAIRHRCKELFLPTITTRVYKKWTPEETLLAVNLREQGYNVKSIAAKLSRSECSVAGRIRDYRKAVS